MLLAIALDTFWIYQMLCAVIISISGSQWRSKDFRAHGQRTLRGPLPILHNLIPLTPPPHTPYSDFAHVYLYHMILDTALFNQYTSHSVFCKFGSL